MHPDEVAEEFIAAPGTSGKWKGCISCHAFAYREDGKRHVTVADDWSGVTHNLAVRTFLAVS